MTGELILMPVLAAPVVALASWKIVQHVREKRRAARARKPTRPSIRPPVYFSALLLGLLLAAGCVPAQAIRLLETRRAVNAGHAVDEGLPVQAREIALDAHDADCVLLELLDGQEIPGPVAERIAAREAARKAAGFR